MFFDEENIILISNKTKIGQDIINMKKLLKYLNKG